MSRSAARRAVRISVAVLAVAFLAWAVWRQRDGFAAALGRLTAVHLVEAFAAVLCALGLNMLSWRASMRAVGAPLSLARAAQVFFWSQLGKYVPGSVWPVLAQVELTRESGVSRARGALGASVSMVVGVVTSTMTATALLVLPDPALRSRYGWVLVPAAVGALSLTPPVLRRLLVILLRLTRRPPAVTKVDGRAIAASTGWSMLMWLVLGAHAWLVAQDLNTAAPAFATVVGAFALAWVVGFIVVVSPAGLGVREAALAFALAGALSPADALALALVSRALMTAGDALAAAVATIAVGADRHRLGRRPSDG